MSAARRLVVVTLLLAFVAASGSAGAAVRGKGLSAPAKLGPYVRYAAVTKNKTAPGQKLAKRFEAWSQRTAALLSAAYGGAAAVSERYSDQNFASMAVLYAVRASSPKLWAPYADPVYLRLVKPELETQTFGAVTCLVQNQPTPRGQKPPKDSSFVLRCQRSDAHLTAIVEAQGDVQRSPSGVAALVDDAWSSLQ